MRFLRLPEPHSSPCALLSFRLAHRFALVALRANGELHSSPCLRLHSPL